MGSIKFFKWANPGPFSSFFSLQFQLYKLKKHRWFAWDSNLGLQDERPRLNHGAMVAARHLALFSMLICTMSYTDTMKQF